MTNKKNFEKKINRKIKLKMEGPYKNKQEKNKRIV
jgi:hypothetical protein